MLTSSDPIEIFAESTIHPTNTQAITGGLILSSQSALVVNNKTGQILYQKNADRIMPIASISKLMSAMVVLDANLDMNETVTITPDEIDRIKGTYSRLAIGTALTRKELLHLSLMSSENRATHALGRTYPGGMGAFVAAMNRKAQSLGMYGSRFYEPTGLNFQNVSTAKDLSLMVNAAAQYPQIRTNSTSNYASVQTKNGQQNYKNSNALVREAHVEHRIAENLLHTRSRQVYGCQSQHSKSTRYHRIAELAHIRHTRQRRPQNRIVDAAATLLTYKCPAENRPNTKKIGNFSYSRLQFDTHRASARFHNHNSGVKNMTAKGQMLQDPL